MSFSPLLKSLLALAVALALFAGATTSVFSPRERRNTWLALDGICFAVVALAHLFEGLRLFPEAGWGEPRSFGHYVDLSAAILGLVFLVLAAGAAMMRQRQ